MESFSYDELMSEEVTQAYLQKSFDLALEQFIRKDSSVSISLHKLHMGFSLLLGIEDKMALVLLDYLNDISLSTAVDLRLASPSIFIEKLEE